MSKTLAAQIGTIRIDRILEMEIPFRTPGQLFPQATDEEIEAHRHWLEPRAMCANTGKLILAVQSYLIRDGRHVILIDTCVGCDKTNWFEPWAQRQDRSWLAQLGDLGVAPGDVDYVFCTHLHGDHCGWNTQLRDGRWVPTFPNAKYILARDEVESMTVEQSDTYNENVLPVIEAGLAVLVDTDYALSDEIRLEPTPGHTPGHVAVLISSNNAEAVMCGDLIHSPLQCVFPHWHYWVDRDQELAARTRHRFLDTHCETGKLVLTAHFPSPSMGYVEAGGDAFRFRNV
jgi:glyoxylase-like metal-dependent hydrolase (beta-lactamase superfamily II)